MYKLTRCLCRNFPALRVSASLLLVWLFTSSALSATYFALEPLDTSSPRATMESFQRYSQAYAKAVFFPEEVSYTAEEAMARAMRCFDLSEVAPILADNVGRESVLLLNEILIRIPLPVPEEIPDREKVREEALERWYIPQTGITLHRVSGGDRKNDFLYTPETINRLSRYFEEVQHLPVREGVFANVDTKFHAANSCSIRSTIRAGPSMIGSTAGKPVSFS